ncbi:MAG: hypothetical protein GEU28_09990 [Dehalococcoidia bacterium]|nr:hypothetical protein [Dehalococcoidia bacterium]
MKVTALRRQKSGRRVNVEIDGEFAFALSADSLHVTGLHEGDQVTPRRLGELRAVEAKEAAYAAALRLLGYRPRSEQELRKRLRLKRIPGWAVETALGRLRRNGLIDDAAFARTYVETRQASSPRSTRMLTRELAIRGVVGDVAEQGMAPVDDLASAREAGEKRARRLAEGDYAVFRRRLGSFLAGRGFAYGVIEATVRELWAERPDPGAAAGA